MGKESVRVGGQRWGIDGKDCVSFLMLSLTQCSIYCEMEAGNMLISSYFGEQGDTG